jgi:hypothetical protein
LTLNKENENSLKTTFLDLYIYIQDNIINTRIYDKRVDFDFDIRNFPDLCGNIPLQETHSIVTSQLIRFAISTSLFIDFKKEVKTLIDKLQVRHFIPEIILSKIKKFFIRYKYHIDKYNINTKEKQDTFFNEINSHMKYE